jgi:hypothetical protein
MTNPTSNFGWQMPTPTDLVTDLPADFEVFGQAVDTSMADLRGGTTGQILSKTTNADMDFTWIANDQGDITAVNVTSPITGGGSSGAVTIGINAATTSVVGAVQLSDSTSTTSSVLASTPTATKAAYDLANTASTTATAAIPKSTVTTAGDVIYGTGSAAVTRLGIGTAGQVLTVNSGATAPEWKSAGVTFIGANATKTANQSLANVTLTAVTFDGTDILDTDSFHNPASNNSRMTIPAGLGGKYLIQATIQFASNTTGGRELQIYKNGTTVLQYVTTDAEGSLTMAISGTYSLVATDYVEIRAYQSSGGALDIWASNSGYTNATSFQVTYLGA